MKKITTGAVVIVALLLIGFKLSSNKSEMAETASLANKVSEQIPVEMLPATLQVYEGNVQALGSLEAITDLTMLSQTEGLVTKKYINKGEVVKKGDLLAMVENSSLKADYDAAKANYERLELDLARFENLAEKEAVTTRQLDEVKIAYTNAKSRLVATKKMYDESFIKATASGTINEDYFQEGANLAKQAKLYDIVDVSELKLSVKLTAENILRIKENDIVEISSDVYPGEKYLGTVSAIAVKADNSKKYEVEIKLKNSPTKPLRAGMFGKVKFSFKNNVEQLFISREALVGSVKNPQVYIVVDNKAHLASIEIGEILEDKMVVVQGLKEGDMVVINGQTNLKEGTTVYSLQKKSLMSHDIDTNINTSKVSK